MLAEAGRKADCACSYGMELTWDVNDPQMPQVRGPGARAPGSVPAEEAWRRRVPAGTEGRPPPPPPQHACEPSTVRGTRQRAALGVVMCVAQVSAGTCLEHTRGPWELPIGPHLATAGPCPSLFFIHGRKQVTLASKSMRRVQQM